MKKFSSAFFAAIVVALFSACGSDGDCSFEGKWKVVSADIQSTKLAPSILEMSKNEMSATVFEFSKEGNISINYTNRSATSAGTWAYDIATQVLTWEAKTETGEIYKQDSKVTACSGSEISISQRMPADSTKEAIATTTMVLQKIK